MSEIAQVPKEAIGVVLEDATAEDWYVGGTTVAELKRTGKSCAARTAVSKSTTRRFSPWSTRPSASSNCRHSMANLDRQQPVFIGRSGTDTHSAPRPPSALLMMVECRPSAVAHTGQLPRQLKIIAAIFAAAGHREVLTRLGLEHSRRTERRRVIWRIGQAKPQADPGVSQAPPLSLKAARFSANHRAGALLLDVRPRLHAHHGQP